jgi:hypothetical protein
MNELPASRLFLKGGDTSGDSSQQERIKRVLAAAGVAGQRVHFLDWLDRNGHFAAYQDIDIAIDPFPHGGGMTTLDALWIGRSSRGLPRANHLVAAGVRDLERARIDRLRRGGSRWLCRSGSRQGFGPRHARSASSHPARSCSGFGIWRSEAILPCGRGGLPRDVATLVRGALTASGDLSPVSCRPGSVFCLTTVPRPPQARSRQVLIKVRQRH